MTPSTTNTAARELLASALDECGWRTDAAEVREGRNPFVRSDHALAAIEKALTQQQGGEQEAVDIDAGMMIRACTAYNEVIPLSGFYSQRPLAMRAALTAALRTKQPAASEGDGCAMCSRWKALAESADLLRSVAEKRAARLEAHAGEAVAYAEAEYEFEVWQDDFVQAGGTAPTVEEVMTEAGHYAMMYGQDGPVRVRYYERREFKPIAAALQAGTP